MTSSISIVNPVAESGVAMTDDELMDLALAEARRALEHDDVPVGAVIVKDGELVASRHNERELTGDPTAHAEVLAIRDAAAAIGSWRLDGCTMVVTLEPCVMCGGALLNARVDRLVYGTPDMAAGACLSLYNVCDDPRLNHRVDVEAGLRSDECSGLLTSFFESKR